jgi:hypothetical protein
MGEMADAFGGGVLADIERLRPSWCSGWLGEMVLDPSQSMGDLKADIRDEWGGEKFLIQILAVDGSVLQKHSLPIAGPPRVEGRRIYRDAEDIPEARQAPQKPLQAGPDPFASQSVTLMGMIMEDASKNRTTVLDSVKEMMGQVQAGQREFFSALAIREEDTEKRASFLSQVQEFEKGAAALDGLRTSLGGDDGDDHDGEPPPGSISEMATEKFAEAMIKRFMKDEPPESRTNGTPHQRGRTRIPDAR